jgi:hypothetical protein
MVHGEGKRQAVQAVTERKSRLRDIYMNHSYNMVENIAQDRDKCSLLLVHLSRQLAIKRVAQQYGQA